jgi:hypothetical protein
MHCDCQKSAWAPLSCLDRRHEERAREEREFLEHQPARPLEELCFIHGFLLLAAAGLDLCLQQKRE